MTRSSRSRNPPKGLKDDFEVELTRYDSRIRKRKNNTYRTLPCPAKKVKGLDRTVDFTNIINTPKAAQVNRLNVENDSKKDSDKKLIDYTVLTKALSKTLESKLQEREDNELKIVIFCNNKPIQSFSVKSNSKAAVSKDDSDSNSPDNSPVKSFPTSPLYNLFENKTTVQASNESAEKQLKTIVHKKNNTVVGSVTIESASTRVANVTSSPVAVTAVTSVLSSAAPSSSFLSSLPTVVPVSIISPIQGIHNIPILKTVDGSNSVILASAQGTFVGPPPGTMLASRQGPVIASSPADLLVKTQHLQPPKVLINAAGKVISGSVGQVKSLVNGSQYVTASQSILGLPASGFKSDVADSNSYNRVINAQELKGDKADNSDDDTDKLVITDVIGSAKVLHDDSQHVNDLDENGNVTCDLCNKSFKQKRYLNRHKIRVHRETSDKPAAIVPTVVKIKVAQNKLEDGCIKRDISIDSKQIEQLIGGDRFVNVADLASKKADGSESEETALQVDNNGEQSMEEDEEIDVTRVKREPSAESDDSVTRYITSIFDDDMVLEEVKFADRGKRSLYHTTAEPVKGGTAKDILGVGKSKPVRLKRNENGLPLTAEGVVEPVYVCEECGKFYRARKTLKDHYFREHAQSKEDEPLYLYITGNKYQCPICFSNFHSGGELVAHTKKHTGELQIPCKLCGKIYSSVHVLRRHIENIHSETRPRPFQCELCNYAASNKWHLKEHYRRHTGL